MSWLQELFDFVTCCLRPSWRHGFYWLSFPSIFRFSPWMIISPSWEQSIDFMIKDCRVRRSDKSLFKTELSIKLKKYRTGLLGNSSQENADEVQVNMLFHQSLPSTGCLLDNLTERDQIWSCFFGKIWSWTELPLCKESLRAPFKSSKQTTGG